MTAYTSVVEALRSIGWYQRDGRLAEQTVEFQTPAGNYCYMLSPIDYRDIMVFADELDSTLSSKSPAIQSLFAKNAVPLVHLIRGVNNNTNSGFKGIRGVGYDLDALQFSPGQFQDPDADDVLPRTSWVRQIAGPGTHQFICGPDGCGTKNHGPLLMDGREAMAVLGFANPALTPCTTAFQVQHRDTLYNLQNLEFAVPGREIPKIDAEAPEVLSVEKLPSGDESGGSLGDLFNELEEAELADEEAEIDKMRAGSPSGSTEGAASSKKIKSIAARLAKALLAMAPRNSMVVELKQPLLVWPEETCLINVRYYRGGQDELRPIGLWVKRSCDLKSLGK